MFYFLFLYVHIRACVWVTCMGMPMEAWSSGTWGTEFETEQNGDEKKLPAWLKLSL